MRLHSWSLSCLVGEILRRLARSLIPDGTNIREGRSVLVTNMRREATRSLQDHIFARQDTHANILAGRHLGRLTLPGSPSSGRG